jgi:acetyltransferase-like isoleucine patch superfamily enzyme
MNKFTLVVRIINALRNLLFIRIISLLGFFTNTTPGFRGVGTIQAFLLRGMGVNCPSERVWIGPRTIIEFPDRLTLGDRVHIGPDTRIYGWGEVVIGDLFLGAPGLCVHSGTHNKATLASANLRVTIGSRVWCGQRVTICAGTEIGDDVIVGAGSVVVKNIPNNVVAAGIPCRPLSALVRSREEMEGLSSPWR